MGKILAIDYGSVRIGLAITDEEKKFALALRTVPADPRDECFNAIRRIVTDENVERIVLGLPLSLDGQEGPQAVSVRSFGNELANNMGMPLDFIDERFSTKSSLFVSQMKGAKYPDAEAARLILETWLEKNKK